MKWKFKGFLIMLLLCVVSLPITADAYQLLGFKKKDNLDLYYNISQELIDMGYKQDILRGFTAWHSANKVKFTKEVSVSGNVNVDYVNSNYGDAYATHRNGSSTLSNITMYKSWKGLDQTRRRETAVHEVGHALGLDHTQTKNNSISVMRTKGFNDKDWPLQDDIDGIKALY
ncbi:matrixin family metalloprotease [Lysinibacillus sp. FSL M8-0355]|uniref:matrixin family metalloprotease n=1 Tax=Lysinibacillus sp. FSL M8-0355 TaxID=2921719 RepID=UPI0030F7AF88